MRVAAPQIRWLSRDDPVDAFPPVDSALIEPNGLLAAGGDLSMDRLLFAYKHGIFPWYSNGEPILWWSPDPRCILLPTEFHVARRLRRFFRASDYSITFNRKFDDVIRACAEDRKGQLGTWITDEMRIAYAALHEAGWAHSIETWHEGRLIGGMYGLGIGNAFFGESMFSRRDNASKAAMLALCKELIRLGISVLDCQVESPHLTSLGAKLVPRVTFSCLLADACVADTQLQPGSADERPIADYL